MNYFLLLVIVGLCGSTYYMYTTDQEKITTLQQQVDDLSSPSKNGGASTAASGASGLAPVPTINSVPTLATVSPLSPAPATPAAPVAPVAPVPVVAPAVVHAAQSDHMNAIDAAANAAVAAANGSSIGTVTTLDHKTYTNCKVLKVEKDGVTFSHDDGITKILYPMMSPDLQKQFGYTPAGAVAATEAEIRASQQAQAATNGAPAAP